MSRARWWLVLATAIACGPPPTDPDAPEDAPTSFDAPDVRADAPRFDGGLTCSATPEEIAVACDDVIVGVECSPDGLGWCCPMGDPTSYPCSCTPSGGFELDPCACSPGHAYCDLPPSGWGTVIDAHGCPTLAVRPTTDCCNCEHDAGVRDAPE